MNVDEIRSKFLGYFKSKGHPVIQSDSLIPQNDPTLLFTGAGMNQFKDYFLGIKTDLKCAASSQKCLRTGDLDEVGKTPYHHSFFEMLGNFSFGDYFKNEAIEMAWDFLTKELKIPENRMRITVHEKDEEAFLIWRDKIGIREDWIYRCGDKSNFWPSNAPKNGPNGPCGPCSEIYYDQNPHEGPRNIDDPDFAEIWNLVFTQYDRQEGGVLIPLKQKNIDTGMGLERLACVLQNRKTNYEIDIFLPIHSSIEKALDITVSEAKRMDLYAISDHIRAIVFSIADGVIPTNEGRGYVIRKLIRRALWHAHELKPGQKIEDPFLFKVVPTVVDVMKTGYPEIEEAQSSIVSTLQNEEIRFLETLETGVAILETELSMLKKNGKTEVSGRKVFELYDTYGFPDELTKSIAVSEGLSVDEAGFLKLMEEQRQRAKKASQISASIFSSSAIEKAIAKLPSSIFVGYEKFESKSRVLYAKLDGSTGLLVLDKTPFYAESGGQVGDQGSVVGKKGQALVRDVQKKGNHIVHLVEVQSGDISVDETVEAKIDLRLREDIMRNHTATHLLHAALREVLGKQVRQLGSMVAPDRLRFDFSYGQALSDNNLRKIEDTVNAKIWENLSVSKAEKSIEDAKKGGAIAFFGEKYGKKVRVIAAGDFSQELCGGTHCQSTGQIGAFVILSDSSIASGTRRIEALTGAGALNYIRMLRSQVLEASQLLKVTPQEISGRIVKLQDNMKRLEKEKTRSAVSQANPKDIVAKAILAGEIHFASYLTSDLSLGELRKLSDEIRNQGRKMVYFLGAESEEKIQFLIGLTPDLLKSNVDIRPFAKDLSAILDASGGGNAGLVQGGAPNRGQYREKWKMIEEKAINYLRGISCRS